MSRVQFLAQVDCFFQTLLQPSSETHPVSYPKITLGSYPNSKFSGTVLRMRICEVLKSCLYRDNSRFIQGPNMTESIVEAICIRTPHTKILQYITFSLSPSTALLLCHWLFLLLFDVSVNFISNVCGGENWLLNVILYYTLILLFT